MVLATADFLASLTGPDGPLGLSKASDARALLRWLVNAAAVVAPRSLFAITYFLIACRLRRVSYVTRKLPAG